MKKDSLPKISIIIPFAGSSTCISDLINKCLGLDYPQFEIIVLPDGDFNFQNPKVKIIPTGHVSPAKKRNIGVNASTGEIVAFIDDDAYPGKNWVSKAISYFNDKNIGVVGGPGLTPEDDSIEQQASGFVWGSWIGSGPIAFRNSVHKTMFVDDYPTCNFFIRKDLFKAIGGFSEEYWRGEDTLLCRAVINKGLKIIYAPDAVVFHHRRKMFLAHLKQIWNCGRYRGFFAKKFPENSRNYYYFLPPVFALGVPFLLIFDFVFLKSFVFVWLFLIYVFIVMILAHTAIKKGIKFYYLVATGIILTHFAYGYSFIQGYLTRRLDK